MQPFALSGHTILLWSLICLCTHTSCAVVNPLWHATQIKQHIKTQTTPNTSITHDNRVQISAVEARPNGLLLQLNAHILPPQLKSAKAIIYKRKDDEDLHILQELTLDEQLAARLKETRGVRLLDKSMTPNTRYSYTFEMHSPTFKKPQRSTRLDWHWDEVLKAPKGLVARADVPPFVELTWAHKKEWGVVIFRRNVLQGERRPKLLPWVFAQTQGLYLDRTIRPGHIYAYRLGYARKKQGVMIYGHLTQELFVTVP